MYTGNLSIDERLHLITRNCQEILVVDELRKLLENDEEIIHYIGFEISGMIHLGTGLISMGKIADFIKAGVKCKILLADFHSYLNKKLGGDWETIRTATENYFKQGLIASLKCYGVNENEVEFVMGRDLYANNITHWETFMEVGQHITLSRNMRSISIMGKQQGTDVSMATLFYPPLQAADIFTLRANLVHAGMDQRKIHVVARQVATKLKINPLKNKSGEVIAPVVVHQNLIAGLTGPESVDLSQDTENLAIDLKMSKSKPNSAVFIHDTPDEIRAKIRKAYAPVGDIKYNPIIDWVKTLIFWGEENGEFTINRPEKFGGNVTYNKVADLIADYESEKLFPLDLKNAIADWLINKLEVARNHFEQEAPKQGLEMMKKYLAQK